MTLSRHREKHFAGSDAVRDLILGRSDGLTTPFALAATSPARSRRTSWS